MAIANPPTPPAAAQPPEPPRPPAPRPRRTSPVARGIALGAFGVVLLVVLFLLLSGSGSTTYHLLFAEGYQLVRGDTVQVGGVPVGSVTDIALTHNYGYARVTISVDSSLAPLHQGTVAQVRVPSLSSVANRYIDLEPGPNNYPAYPAGATLPASASREVTDLDQLFDTLNPKTRKGLQEFIQGTAAQYAGAGHALGESAELFAPALNAVDHEFAELVRDQPVFTHFLVETAKATTTIAGHQEQLTDLIENANHTFESIGSEQSHFAEGLKLLPVTLQQGDRTFAELPGTFAALEELVKVSRPTTKPLTLLLERLRPLLLTATPAVRNLALAFNRPGPNNDLTDLARALPALAHTLESTSPATVRASQESVPITAFFGPYSPDLAGTLRTFGQAASFYDADGHYAHVTPLLPDFKLGSENNLTPASSPQAALEGLQTGQLRRCPGAATEPASDGSSPFADGELLTCVPSETP
jgi:phospholipid/cholesterol/gamma-HCH transport system substrate-binding protein